MIPGVLAGLCLMGTSIYLLCSREIVMGMIPILFVAIAAIGMACEPGSIKRRMRKSPLMGETFEVNISEESFDLSSSLARTSLKWDLFTKVVHFKDGLLLFQNPSGFIWLPYSGLRTGNIQQLEELVQRHVPEHTRQ